MLERDGDRLEARPFLGSSDQIIEAARAALRPAWVKAMRSTIHLYDGLARLPRQ